MKSKSRWFRTRSSCLFLCMDEAMLCGALPFSNRVLLPLLLCFGLTAQAEFHVLDVESRLFVKYGRGATVNPVQVLGAEDNHDDEIILSICSENSGRLARFYIRFTEKNHRYNGRSMHLPRQESAAGYIGQQVLREADPVSDGKSFVDKDGAFQVPLDTVMWYGIKDTGLQASEQSCNDLALAVRFTDRDGSGTKTAGDVMEIVGVVYAVGPDSVYGLSADQLTGMLSDPALKCVPLDHSKPDELVAPIALPESVDTLGFLFASTTR